MLSTLHIINAVIDAPQQQQLLQQVTTQTSVLFTTDAVYLLRDSQFIDALIAQSPEAVYAIDEDCEARAVLLSNKIEYIDYDKFVALTLTHQNSLTW